ncbi:XdhC family protein [Ahrensia sp. 13_GOM-1096m]|uniref:XdhC family protein n=1 Tax=Ahrensia sp. 13_GOM-1096m TaxID=1380380 RepID=UPI00138B0D98
MPTILSHALLSKAFYITAQGSKRAQENLMHQLSLLKVAPKDILKLKSPIGLIPSARETRILVISVLADILAKSKNLVS